MLFVTFHGGKATSAVPCPVNNVYAYDETATAPPPPYLNVLSVPASVELSELRMLRFANNYLYVANGSKKQNDVLCFQQSSQTANPLFIYVGEFVTDAVNSIAHPFGICFDTSGNAYVSNQDTNVVTQLEVASNFQTGSAVTGNAASYLTQFGSTFLNGTFVASHDPVPNYAGTPHVPDKKGGLDFSPTKGAISHSVRDVVVCNGILCVADEAGNLVKMYDLTSGTFLGACTGLPSDAGPIHLLVQEVSGKPSTLYVSVGSGVYYGTPAQSGNTGTLAFSAQTLNPGLPDEASGMCFDGEGNFYIAVRAKNQIYQYNSSFQSGTVFLDNLQDNPEFVIWQPNA